MIVTCDSCHKTFVYEKYDGFCPKCGSYVSGTFSLEKNVILNHGDGATVRSSKARKVSSSENLRTRQANRMDEDSHSHRGRKLVRILIVLVLITIIAAAILMEEKDSGSSEKIDVQETLLYDQVERIPLNYGTIHWETPQVAGYNKDNDQKLIAVPFIVEDLQEGIQIHEYTKVYLQVDGLYISNLSLYTCKKYFSRSIQELEAVYAREIKKGEGTLFYLVPADTENISVYMADYQNREEHGLTACYQVDLEVGR